SLPFPKAVLYTAFLSQLCCMKLYRLLALIPLLVILTSCFKTYKGRISIDGSSSVYPITEAVAEEYRMDHRDIRVTVGVSGTGGGFKKFARGETDISNASRPIK